jgi:tetratricopeptide (TPR) repeat protein
MANPAWTYAKRGEYDKAMDACNQVVKLEPSSATTHYAIGRLYSMMGNHEKAAIEMIKIAKELKFNPKAYTQHYGMTTPDFRKGRKARNSGNTGPKRRCNKRHEQKISAFKFCSRQCRASRSISSKDNSRERLSW